jgi:hypothetical protein
MKKLQRLTMAVVLTLMLAASAFAGDIWLGKAPPPPPPGSSSTTTPGDIWTGTSGETQSPAFASDSVEGIALNLLQCTLSMF